MNYKLLYQKSLLALGKTLHFGAHSHHLWPDCVQEAQNQYVKDAYRWADEKWGEAIAPVEKECKQLLAQHLELSDPNQICFAPNVHTLFFRLVSCFDLRKTLNILSTDSEFYSFSRQALRLSEYDNITVDQVPTLPFLGLKARFLNQLREKDYDIVYISQVFFNSGLAIDFMEELAQSVTDKTMIVVDGYHAMGAIPTSLKKLENRIFYLAGGYKYLQSGEGVCFMTVPNTASHYRPLYTGWFAEFDSLDNHENTVSYAPDASRFLGATTDPSGIYRMHSVLKSWKEQKIDITAIHNFISSLQAYFINQLESQNIFGLNKMDLIHIQEGTTKFGHFLTFRTENAQQIQRQLRELDIITDCREDRLRFGFGMYHSTEDIDQLFERLT
ncbi:aminotransferase class V-fold PLP-dependent enzyme [Reichenbachiella ulvae]|uniref:Aminotransferase class V-fold PLP-dependent enzyme n=1 Tax=Reichenbachiella ulvae TaxID=2980104 RepID=A0ABT3CYV0_9BACT|nr:aminotransferase class V-fold PLP-dependent enzyme [Reichenbachiella ulvae]MCV9388699.1 aminotransferase class V-fold PLP-dependent enzyme [Reichenbachiella ulvae]